MDRAAEGLAESVIKTNVSVLIPPWEVCARALASKAIPLQGCSPLLSALPSKQLHQHSSVITETTFLAWLLIDHCRAYTGQRWDRIASLLPCSKVLSVHWEIVQFNGLKPGAVPLQIRCFCHGWCGALGSGTMQQF